MGRDRFIARIAWAVSALSMLFCLGSSLNAQQPQFFSADDRPARVGAARAGGGTLRRRVASADLAQLTTSDRRSGLTIGTSTSLDLNLFDDVQYIAQLDRVEDLGGGRFSWIGTVIGEPEGRVVLAVSDGVLAGSVTTMTDAYEIRWQPGSVYEIQQVDRSGFQQEAQPLRVESSRLTIQADQPAVATDDGSTFDLLVAYTPAARDGAGGTAAITSLIALGVSETNQAYASSGINSRMRLVGTTEWNQAEAGTSSPQLSAFRASSEIAALRNSLGADLVLLVVQSMSDACGISYLMTSLTTGFAANAYSVVQRSCISPNYTFAHELAHAMGSDHAPEDNATHGVYGYSSGYKDPGGSFRTIMAYDCTPTCRRALMFSSPSNVFNGRPTGSASQDNARSLANTATTVANFRSSAAPTPPTAPSIPSTPSAPTSLSSSASGSSITLQWAAPSGGATPASYTIEAGSSSGLANLANLSTGSTATSFSASGVPSGVYYVRVRAANSAGTSTASNESVLTVGSVCGGAPGAAGGLRVTTNTGGTVMLAWTAASGVPTTYIVEAGSGPGLSDLATTDLSGTATTLTASGVGRGTYYVRVRGRNACGTGAPSNEITVVVS